MLGNIGRTCVVVAALVASGLPSAASAADLTLTFRDGRVTLIAHDVSLRQILTQWETAGKTRIVNRDRVPQMSISLELVDVPESRALDALLRQLGGFIAAPRPAFVAGLSTFDRLYLMPILARAVPVVAGGASHTMPPAQQVAPGGPMPGRFGQPFMGQAPPDDPIVDGEEPDEPDELVPDEPEEEPAPPAFDMTRPGIAPMPPSAVPMETNPAGGDPNTDPSRPLVMPLTPGVVPAPVPPVPVRKNPSDAPAPPPKGPGR